MTIFSRIIGSIELGIGDIWKALRRLGVTPEVAQAAVVDLVNVGLAAAEAPLLHQLVMGYKQPEIVTNLINLALGIPNIPADVRTLLQGLPKLAADAAEDPATGLAKFMNEVTGIETKLGIIQAAPLSPAGAGA